ncbi:MAG: hypothetical protein KKA42_11105, partial [candidate division Zixibacteria bacterium]|nr:hypothetical protein [candidate division Zixibacteria bacterium]
MQRLVIRLALACMLFLMPAVIFAQSVSLDHVDGAYNNGTMLRAGGTATFYIRFTNPSDRYFNINNGFRVY